MMGGAPVYGFISAGVVIKSEVIPRFLKALITLGITHTIKKYAVKKSHTTAKNDRLKNLILPN